MNRNRNQKGVTLIELLIVILILAALSAIFIPRISQQATNAKAKLTAEEQDQGEISDAEACRTNIDALNAAIELYSNKNGSYPANLDIVATNKKYFPHGMPRKAKGTLGPTTRARGKVFLENLRCEM